MALKDIKKGVHKVLFDKGQINIKQMLENTDKLSIEKFFYEWRGNVEQTDDMVVIGVRV